LLRKRDWVPAAYWRISPQSSGRDYAHHQSSSLQSRTPRDIPHGNNVPWLTDRGAPHPTSTSGSRIAVITEPASRAELEPVIAEG